MKEYITVEDAINKGQRMVNTPVAIIMFGTMVLFYFLGIVGIISLWFTPISIILGPSFGWLYWSFMITKWRIWAFSNVQNICKLEAQAIRNQLIWERGSRFEKTEIRSKKEKRIIEEITARLDDCNKLKPSGKSLQLNH